MPGTKTTVALLVASLTAASASGAFAHVWNIGYKSENGGLTFYGLSYHGPLNSTYDDFAANPAGFIINGTNVPFDLGSVVDDPSDCIGAGGLVSGTCSSTWNALSLDGAIHANGYASNLYGKYATTTLTASALAGLGIGTGSNSVTLSTFANNVDWDGLSFSSATVPIDIVVKPEEPVNQVPVPAGMPLIAAALGALAFVRRRI